MCNILSREAEKSINNSILGLFEHYSINNDERKKPDKHHFPVLYHNLIKDSLLFIGFNPSSPGGQAVRERLRLIGESNEFESVHNDISNILQFLDNGASEFDSNWQVVTSFIQNLSKDKQILLLKGEQFAAKGGFGTNPYQYFYPFSSLLEETNKGLEVPISNWEHIDLYPVRFGKQEELKSYFPNSLDNPFLKSLAKNTLEIIHKIQPRAVVVCNQDSAVKFKALNDFERLDEGFGCNFLNIEGQQVPVFYSGTLGYGRMDDQYKERFGWHIRYVLRKLAS